MTLLCIFNCVTFSLPDERDLDHTLRKDPYTREEPERGHYEKNSIQLLALKMEGGHREGRNARQHPEAEKYKEMDSPLELPHNPANTFIFSQ